MFNLQTSQPMCLPEHFKLPEFYNSCWLFFHYEHHPNTVERETMRALQSVNSPEGAEMLAKNFSFFFEFLISGDRSSLRNVFNVLMHPKL